jgi:hypothetical protein
MKQEQRQDRHTAAQEFQESLEQLSGILQETPNPEKIPPQPVPDRNLDDLLSKHTDILDLADFEDAVADIERYLAQKTRKPPIQ